MKLLKKIIYGTFMSFLVLPIVSASTSPYFINDNNVEMTEQEYNLIVDRYGENYTNIITQEDFDFDISHDVLSKSENTIYILDTTIYGPGDVEISSFSTEISKEEFDEINLTGKSQLENIELLAGGAGDKIYYSTNTKQLSLVVYHYIAPVGQTYINSRIILNCLWMKAPKVRSFDVIAVRWEATNSYAFNMTSATGKQSYYLANNDYESVSYSNGGTNSKKFGKGVGISMNIVNDLDEGLNCSLTVNGTSTGKGTLTAYGSYQHATKDVTLAQSQSYSLSPSGLGGVIYFSNSSIRNSYDGMQGVSAYNEK